MDSNSLPMAPDLDVFPRVLRLLVLGTILLFLFLVVLVILAGVFST